MRAAKRLATAALLSWPLAAHAQTAAPAAAPSVSAPAKSQIPEDPAAKARWEKFRAACGADLQTHCANSTRGTDQSRADMRQCIDTNKAKFSPGCQTAVAERAAERAARKDASPADVKPKG
jgi:hypothetical protein